MNPNIKKQKYFKNILNHLIENAPNGVYAGDLREKFGKEYNEVIHYLEHRQAVHLDYSVMKDPNIEARLMYLIFPDSYKLLEIKNETFWKLFWKQLFTPSTLIALGSLAIALISLFISLRA